MGALQYARGLNRPCRPAQVLFVDYESTLLIVRGYIVFV